MRLQLRLVSLIVVCGAVPSVRAASPPPAVAIEHVTVLPMTSQAAALNDTTVIIRDGRIASIAPSKQSPLPTALKRINASGKWLMPGLTDTHVYLVAHAEEFGQQVTPPAFDSIPQYVEMSKRNGTWLITTLTFVAAGIPVLTGTDAGIPGVFPGFSLPSGWFGVAGDRGTAQRCD